MIRRIAAIVAIFICTTIAWIVLGSMILYRTYHWEPQAEVKRYEWEAGDVIYIPPNTIQQHFNADAERPVRLISAINRIYRHCGLNDLEQIEDAPEYRPNVEVTPAMVQDFMRTKMKETA